MQPQAYSIEDTARLLSIGRTTIYRMIADGRLETLHVGRRHLVRADSLRKLIEAA